MDATAARPHTTESQALTGPRAMGLEPLPWFPFACWTSPGSHGVAATYAQAAERLYWRHARRLGARPRLTLLVLDRAAWQAYADAASFDRAPIAVGGTLLIPARASEVADAEARLAGPMAAAFDAHARCMPVAA